MELNLPDDFNLKKERYKEDSEGNIRVSQTNVKGTISQNVQTGALTLRLFLTKKQKDDLTLERGEITSMKVIIV
jgi:hypothetical protein